MIGLFISDKRNCSRIALRSNGSLNHQSLHHFISNSPWDRTLLVSRIIEQFIKLVSSLNLLEDLCLVIDESGFSKKGENSCGVQRQYNGSQGKVDNCQIGVFGALVAGSLSNIVSAKLFKPQTGVSKIELAKQIIYSIVIRLKVPVKYVCFDAFYGRDLALLGALSKAKIAYLADIPSSQTFSLVAFQMRLPKSDSKRGRKPKLKKATQKFISCANYYKTLNKSSFKKVKVRRKNIGILQSYFHLQRVFIIDPITKKCKEQFLLIRKDADGTIKFSFCSTDQDYNIKELAYRQSKRYFIERNFQESKQQLGMDHYQCKSENAWEAHMTICMLAMLFINSQKCLIYFEHNTYLTTPNIQQILLATYLFEESHSKICLDDILAKVPPNKALAYIKIYLRI